MIEDNCAVCGLPKDLCVCSDINKKSSIIEIKNEKRKFGKVYTIIIGLDNKNDELKVTLKTLKNKFGCGGSISNGNLDLQGEHKNDVKKVLISLSYPEDSIHITYGNKRR